MIVMIVVAIVEVNQFKAAINFMRHFIIKAATIIIKNLKVLIMIILELDFN